MTKRPTALGRLRRFVEGMLKASRSLHGKCAAEEEAERREYLREIFAYDAVLREIDRLTRLRRLTKKIERERRALK